MNWYSGLEFGQGRDDKFGLFDLLNDSTLLRLCDFFDWTYLPRLFDLDDLALFRFFGPALFSTFLHILNIN